MLSAGEQPATSSGATDILGRDASVRVSTMELPGVIIAAQPVANDARGDDWMRSIVDTVARHEGMRSARSTRRRGHRRRIRDALDLSRLSARPRLPSPVGGCRPRWARLPHRLVQRSWARDCRSGCIRTNAGIDVVRRMNWRSAAATANPRWAGSAQNRHSGPGLSGIRKRHHRTTTYPGCLGWCAYAACRTVEQMTDTITADLSVAPASRGGRRLPLKARNAILTADVVLAVGLLGDAAGYLAVAIRTSTIEDPGLVHDSAKTLNMFSLVFGIPLSFGVLLTGLALGLGTRWGVFRYPGSSPSLRSSCRSSSSARSSSDPAATSWSTAPTRPLG